MAVVCVAVVAIVFVAGVVKVVVVAGVVGCVGVFDDDGGGGCVGDCDVVFRLGSCEGLTGVANVLTWLRRVVEWS